MRGASTVNRPIAAAAVASAIVAGAAAAGPAEEPSRARPGLHLVIGSERFRDALAPYLAWRASTPQNDGVRFESLESILGADVAPNSPEAPERIKRFLFERWRGGRLSTCLLVGDGDAFPVRFMVLDRADAAAANWAFYPSDLYYADLAKPDGSFEDWNSSRDGVHARYFGEVHGETNKGDPINFDGIDHDPEIAVGRWPVSAPDAAGALALKTIEWEKAVDARIRQSFPPVPPPPDRARDQPFTQERAKVFAVGGWVDVRDRAKRIASILDPVVPGGARALVHDDASTQAPDAAAMRHALHHGALILLHTGHGQPWGWEQCLSRQIVDESAPPAGTPPPILFSAGCSTAEWTTLPPYCAYRDETGVDHKGTTGGEKFDAPPPAPAPIQSGGFNRTSLSEALVVQPQGGAIAVIGCSTGSQPCAVSLLEGFAEACAELSLESPLPTLGEAWRRALLSYRRRERLDALVPTADWYPPSIFFQGMKFVLLGDPSLRLPVRPSSTR